MALTLGSVTVDTDGTVTKSGECGTLYDLLVGTFPPPSQENGGAAVNANMAKLATVLAGYTHGLLTARARVKVATTDTGLQRMPASTAENTDTKGPSGDKLLVIV